MPSDPVRVRICVFQAVLEAVQRPPEAFKAGWSRREGPGRLNLFASVIGGHFGDFSLSNFPDVPTWLLIVETYSLARILGV